MSILFVVVGSLAALAALIVRALAVDEVRGYIQRRIAASVDAIIASLPTDLQQEWADEWRAELDELISTPVTAALFARGLRRSALELTCGRAADKSKQSDTRDTQTTMATDLDFSDRRRQTALQEAAQNMTRAYEILRTQVGAPRLIDNAFLREAMICATTGLIWKGGRGDFDAIDPKTGETVELKSTKLEYSGGKIQFLTSHGMLARLRSSDYWLFSVFDGFSDLAIVYRCNRADMSATLDAIEEQIQAGRQNHSRITLDSIRTTCEVIFQNNDFEEYEASPGRWRIRRRSPNDTRSGGRWAIIPGATNRIWARMPHRRRG